MHCGGGGGVASAAKCCRRGVACEYDWGAAIGEVEGLLGRIGH